MIQETCKNCFEIFLVEDSFFKNRLKDKKLIYCPNGHPQVMNCNLTSEESEGLILLSKNLARENREYKFRILELNDELSYLKEEMEKLKLKKRKK